MQRNLHEFPDFVRMAGELGTDEVLVRNMIAFTHSATLESQDQWQRDLALAKIGEGLLPQLGKVRVVVETVVSKLEGETELFAEMGQTGQLRQSRTARDGPHADRGPEKEGGLMHVDVV